MSFILQGSVFRARWRGTQVAVKCIYHEIRGDSNLAVSREVMVGQIMGHPNLVSLCLMFPVRRASDTLQGHCRCFKCILGHFSVLRIALAVHKTLAPAPQAARRIILRDCP